MTKTPIWWRPVEIEREGLPAVGMPRLVTVEWIGAADEQGMLSTQQEHQRSEE
jgi:hypothetical protein